jgi:hypothetical protein
MKYLVIAIILCFVISRLLKVLIVNILAQDGNKACAWTIWILVSLLVSVIGGVLAAKYDMRKGGRK